MHLKNISSVSTIAEILSSSPLTLGVFSEVVKLVKIFMIIPITTAIYCRKIFFVIKKVESLLEINNDSM